MPRKSDAVAIEFSDAPWPLRAAGDAATDRDDDVVERQAAGNSGDEVEKWVVHGAKVKQNRMKAANAAVAMIASRTSW